MKEKLLSWLGSLIGFIAAFVGLAICFAIYAFFFSEVMVEPDKDDLFLIDTQHKEYQYCPMSKDRCIDLAQSIANEKNPRWIFVTAFGDIKDVGNITNKYTATHQSYHFNESTNQFISEPEPYDTIPQFQSWLTRETLVPIGLAKKVEDRSWSKKY